MEGWPPLLSPFYRLETYQSMDSTVKSLYKGLYFVFSRSPLYFESLWGHLHSFKIITVPGYFIYSRSLKAQTISYWVFWLWESMKTRGGCACVCCMQRKEENIPFSTLQSQLDSSSLQIFWGWGFLYHHKLSCLAWLPKVNKNPETFSSRRKDTEPRGQSYLCFQFWFMDLVLGESKERR